MLQLNGKLSPEDQYKAYNVSGTLLQADNIENISKVNFDVSAGFSGGSRCFKFFAQYQYGITNILNNLNAEGLLDIDPDARNFQGHQGLAIGGILFYF